MKLTRIQKLQIEAEQKVITERTHRVSSEFHLGMQYAKNLEKAGSYIAALALYSQIWENLILCLLLHHKSRRRLLDIRDETDRFGRIDLRKISDLTLGSYIQKLNEFDFSDKHEIMQNLREFNRMRNEAVHHAFEGKQKDLNAYENKIKEYLDKGSIETIRQAISNIFDELGTETNEIKKDD